MKTKLKSPVTHRRKILITSGDRQKVIASPVMAVGVAIFALIGAVLLASSRAATPTASFQAEAGNRSGNASIVSDSTASGSSAVKFTATATSGNCTSGAVNSPGTADPWGTCWPGPQNTGVPTGTTLTKRGSINITQAGFVLENVEVDGCITLGANAHNVTIRNVLVKSNTCFFMLLNDDGAQNLQVIDSEFDGMNTVQGDSAIGGHNINLTRVNIHGMLDGMKLGSNDTVKDSYFHDFAYNNTDDPHNDAWQGLDANGVTITRNTCIMNPGGNSCLIFSQNSSSDWEMRNVTFSNNLLQGGGYTVYGGQCTACGDNPSKASNIRIIDNYFSTGQYPRGGAFGPLTSVDPPVVTLSGNKWADGPKAGQAVTP